MPMDCWTQFVPFHFKMVPVVVTAQTLAASVPHTYRKEPIPGALVLRGPDRSVPFQIVPSLHRLKTFNRRWFPYPHASRGQFEVPWTTGTRPFRSISHDVAINWPTPELYIVSTSGSPHAQSPVRGAALLHLRTRPCVFHFADGAVHRHGRTLAASVPSPLPSPLRAPLGWDQAVPFPFASAATRPRPQALESIRGSHRTSSIDRRLPEARSCPPPPPPLRPRPALVVLSVPQMLPKSFQGITAGLRGTKPFRSDFMKVLPPCRAARHWWSSVPLMHAAARISCGSSFCQHRSLLSRQIAARISPAGPPRPSPAPPQRPRSPRARGEAPRPGATHWPRWAMAGACWSADLQCPPRPPRHADTASSARQSGSLRAGEITGLC